MFHDKNLWRDPWVQFGYVTEKRSKVEKLDLRYELSDTYLQRKVDFE